MKVNPDNLLNNSIILFNKLIKLMKLPIFLDNAFYSSFIKFILIYQSLLQR